MFENTIQTNGTRSWKWVTITGRVYVDNAALEQLVDESQKVDKPITYDEAFEELARERLHEDAIPNSDEPFKFDSIDFPA
jgi:hypothetical protein